MSVRLRRLQSDYDKLRKRLEKSRYIFLRKATGNPPEKYQIEYRVKGLMLRKDGQLVESSPHLIEITLTRNYPHRAPHCKMLTPIFHPNINSGAICIGDHWAASESLIDLIIRIGQIITYQSYNTKSPLNAEAARWTDQNEELLPVDPCDLIPPDNEPPKVKKPEPETLEIEHDHCANCRITSREAKLETCPAGHPACPDCLINCERCGSSVCLACDIGRCSECDKLCCLECASDCPICGKHVCADHAAACAVCGKLACPQCAKTCAVCGRTLCANHLGVCAECGEPVCADCAARCEGCGANKLYHPDELQKCQECGTLVCAKHLRKLGSGEELCFNCAVKCAGCGNVGRVNDFGKCERCGVAVCPDCAVKCRACGKTMCPTHAPKCPICGKPVCADCSIKCEQCGQRVCRLKSHAARCSVCKKIFCRKCLVKCSDCGRTVCGRDAAKCRECGEIICRKCAERCSVCRRFCHTRHEELKPCVVCGENLCSTCRYTCSQCGQSVCAKHAIEIHNFLSPGVPKLLCANCYHPRVKNGRRAK